MIFNGLVIQYFLHKCSTYGKFESKKISVVFSFKLNTYSFIRSVYYNICMTFSQNILFRELVYWERKGNFKTEQPEVVPLYIG